MIELEQCRIVKEGNHGEDIEAYKRGFSRAGYLKWKPGGDFTRTFGPNFTKSVKEFQKDHKIRANGVIGKATHNAICRARRKSDKTEYALDARAVALYEDFCGNYNKDTRTRLAIISAAHYWYTVRDKIAYAQIRPMHHVRPPAYWPFMDCSWFVTSCYFVGKAPDPNGRGYDGQGYTGTLLANGTRILSPQAKPGDLIFFGFTRRGSPAFPIGSPTHVAVYAGDGYVYSMGSSAGPSYYPVSYRPDLNCYMTYI